MRITVSDSIDLATVKIAKITAETTLDGIPKLAAKKLQNQEQDDFEPAGTERLFISLKGGTRFADLEDADDLDEGDHVVVAFDGNAHI